MKQMMSAIVISLSIVLTLSSCDTVRVVPSYPALPQKLAMPSITVKMLECVSDDTYILIKERSNLYRARIEMLRKLVNPL